MALKNIDKKKKKKNARSTICLVLSLEVTLNFERFVFDMQSRDQITQSFIIIFANCQIMKLQTFIFRKRDTVIQI